MIYLDNAATTLHKPPEVAEAVKNAILTAGNASRGAHGVSLSASRMVFETRSKLAKLFGKQCCRCIAAGIFAVDQQAQRHGLAVSQAVAVFILLGQTHPGKKFLCTRKLTRSRKLKILHSVKLRIKRIQRRACMCHICLCN